KELAKENIDAARAALADILCNYQGFRQCHVILVFDAYKVRGGAREVEQYHNLYVVYTREAETADMYIERATHELAKEHRTRVVSSDGAEQIIVMGHGALRVSARAFEEEVRAVEKEIREFLGE
uniref:NYN domain-containing protein n=1 Tax=Gemmiger formicilis TaxID=745368 RepID=UPI0040260025